ncbi:TraM recognition domain-containing protein [Cryobacterium sp. CG_9.6]|uniref:type IV secretory system conjugative DNA transfer family protein n=1 Tax=Cryobacterium sp. CG_9.6 TaxID=2760710 RepID=UPI002473311F|nr:TraM recognition domain-containing protein [Cryobacterium sp. CG_9.6]MDH6238555.1 type IV secretory pathway TraG/TraD family ATPase VirD4 [Cryobacterium sp. CG_9.6]
MSASNRRNQNGLDGQTIMLIVCLALVAVALSTVWVAVTWGSQLDGVNPDLTSDPFGLFFGVLQGSVTWSASATWILAATLVAVLVLSVLVAVSVSRARRRRSNVDGAATYMSKGRDLRALSATGAKATAHRLGVTDWLGVPIGITVAGRQKLYGSPEDMHVDIWGPRTGKSTSRAIPAILSAPGAVLTTSNKRDVLDATRDVRAAGGGRVWAFDPQRIALEEPTWWWNPLSYVTDDVKAAKLAEHFATGSRAGDSRADPYFDNAGQDLLAGFLLAAAVAGLPITKVFTWTTTPGDEAPVDILRAHGYDQMADAVDGQVNGEPRRRDSVYGTAAQMASCLKVRAIGQWVTPLGGNVAGDSRPQFDPHAFVRSTDTLYSLSKEGKGTAGPLVTALTAATVEAAEDLATTQPGGRLAVPLLGVLDEAANVCRWHGLPDLYSHYGSRGIVLMTILQSWSQGVEVWGRDGMRKLWSASNIAVYGGGVKEPEFLNELSQMVGDYDKHTTSTSVGRGNRSTSHQVQRERTLDVADLGALPRGRAVVFASGAPATLIETIPWMRGTHADAVRASIAAHDPASTPAVRPEASAPAEASPVGGTQPWLNAAPRTEDEL